MWLPGHLGTGRHRSCHLCQCQESGNQEAAHWNHSKKIPLSLWSRGITAATAVVIITAWSLKFSVRPLLWQLLLDACELVTTRSRNAQSGTTASATVPQHPRSWSRDTDVCVAFLASWKRLQALGWSGSASLLPSASCVVPLRGRLKFSSWLLAVKEPGECSFWFPNLCVSGRRSGRTWMLNASY